MQYLTLHTLNLHNVICQLYINKAEKKNKENKVFKLQEEKKTKDKLWHINKIATQLVFSKGDK